MEVNGHVLHYPYGKTAISLLVGTLMLGVPSCSGLIGWQDGPHTVRSGVSHRSTPSFGEIQGTLLLDLSFSAESGVE